MSRRLSTVRADHRAGTALASTMFQPDVLVPGQWLRGHTRQLSPEQRLALAVLEDAVGTLLSSTVLRDVAWSRRVQEDLAWLRDTDAKRPFTFAYVCQALGLDPGWIRGGVERSLEARAEQRRVAAMDAGELRARLEVPEVSV